MSEPTVRRPRTLFEKTWVWMTIGLVLIGLAGSASYFGIRQIGPKAAPSAKQAFLLISILGGFTLLLILLAFSYQIRKRVLQESVGGTMLAWLKAHVWLGIVAVFAALAHAFVFPLTTGISSGKITGAVLTLLVVSGVLWRSVYSRIPQHVATTVGNLAIRDTAKAIVDLSVELEKLRAGKSKAFHEALDDLRLHRKNVREVEKNLSQFEPSERQTWEEAKFRIAKIEELRKREHKQRRFHRFMQGWKAIHLPLAAILLGSVAFHLFDVFNVDRSIGSKPHRDFAASADCARCHSQIVDEWKLSMHRDAQTSTTTAAQSVFALQKFPDFKKVCVNCHAPIGVKFSQKATFALAEPNPLADPTQVQDEGVTCVVCHTMPHAPAEIAGASDKFPIGKRTGTSFGALVGPPLANPKQIPSTAHDVIAGFMTSTVSSSQMCAACHNVKVDINGNGIVNPVFSATAAQAGAPVDSDHNGVLDQNEVDVENGILKDLVLQTTYDEWQDYIAARGGTGAGCVDCHMPASQPASLIDRPPGGLSVAKRPRQKHVFVAVDYDLNSAYYSQKSMPKDALQKLLEEREQFLLQTASVSVTVGAPANGGQTPATVELRTFEGHSFPTGFAFARQFWLEVSAKTASGKPVCLAADPHGIPSPCASGKIDKPTDELATCETAGDGRTFAAEPFGNVVKDLKVKLSASSPLNRCDPWLTNFQKILTDGDKDGDGIFNEVVHQSLLADIVKLRVRTADEQVMKPISSGGTAKFEYRFDASQTNEPLVVTAILRLRHIPPSFIKGLDGFYPKGPKGFTSKDLLKNMTVVNIASNQPLASPRTSPAPSSFSKQVSAVGDPSRSKKRGPFWPLALFGIFTVPMLGYRRRDAKARSAG
ncbi:MAG: hypothetical protein LC723_10450 [Actinobacteria bacterium]|nr:hypothetical protein [Actinomycetota bacterium]